MTRALQERSVAGLVVSEWGDATSRPAVLALSGLGSSGRTWAPVARSLGDRYVLSPHLRGRGGSRSLSGGTGLHAHARDVAAVLAELDLRDVVVVGHSMGAYLAPLVAAEAPHRVARLVLVDGGVPPELPFFMGPRLTRFAFTRDMTRTDRDWASAEELVAKKGAPLLKARPDLHPFLLEALAGDLEGEPGRLRPAADVARCAADAVDTFFGGDATRALESLAVPAHLVAATDGKRDGAKAFLSERRVREWTERLPLLTAERVQANHVTVVWSDEVRTAVLR